jgi:hypothetical protein
VLLVASRAAAKCASGAPGRVGPTQRQAIGADACRLCARWSQMEVNSLGPKIAEVRRYKTVYSQVQASQLHSRTQSR